MKIPDWCDLESHLKTEQYFFETLPSTSKKLIVVSLSKNFVDSILFCRKICGRMVLPNSQKESDELSSIAKRYEKNFPIRYSDADREGNWGDFDNGATVNFRNWASGQPREYDSYAGYLDFAYFSSDGKMYATSRGAHGSVICELSQES